VRFVFVAARRLGNSVGLHAPVVIYQQEILIGVSEVRAQTPHQLINAAIAIPFCRQSAHLPALSLSQNPLRVLTRPNRSIP
jgi:hypothetical protein